MNVSESWRDVFALLDFVSSQLPPETVDEAPEIAEVRAEYRAIRGEAERGAEAGRKLGDDAPRVLWDGILTMLGALMQEAADLHAERNDRTKHATETRQKTSQHLQQRARELREDGLSVAQIAVHMTSERNEADKRSGRIAPSAPIRERTVERYLAACKTPTGRRAVGPDDERSDFSGD